MLPKVLKNFKDRIKYLPQLYKKGVQPRIMDLIKVSIVQPGRSLIRFHHSKKAYNQNYRMFITLCKGFCVAYIAIDFIQYDFASSSLMGRPIEQTEYMLLVQKASSDSAGVNSTIHAMKQMIDKGKQKGLLSIQLNQLSYLLQPFEIAWQGRYMASLKS